MVRETRLRFMKCEGTSPVCSLKSCEQESQSQAEGQTACDGLEWVLTAVEV